MIKSDQGKALLVGTLNTYKGFTKSGNGVGNPWSSNKGGGREKRGFSRQVCWHHSEPPKLEQWTCLLLSPGLSGLLYLEILKTGNSGGTPRKLDSQYIFPSTSAPNPDEDGRPWEKPVDRSPKLALTAANCLAGTNVQAQLAIKTSLES